MSGRIITARHGRPNLCRDMRITAREYGAWWAEYDASGLHPDERAPEGLVQLARGAANIIASTLPRAIETAHQVSEGAGAKVTDPIFIEAPLPPPPVPFVRLKPGAWGVISRSFWFFGYAPRGVETHGQAWARVRRIAARLSEYAEEGDVLLCAHGYLNWMINRQLKQENWRLASRDGGNHYWSWRVYEPEGYQAPFTAKPAMAG